jgi:NADPH2:quinone reductase
MSTKMKAVVLNGTGGPEVLDLAQVDIPWPGRATDVLVRLKAAALNPADGYFRAFGPYLKGDGPCILGHDGAGVVEQVGSAVTRIRPGDEVCFCNGGIGGTPGTYAEFATVPETQLVRKPESVDFCQAAALPLVLITAWESLYDRANVKRDEHVLVHGGAGGTGHIAVQLASLRDARVAATVSSEAKADFLRGLGAERPIFYRTVDFVNEVKDWTGGKGADAALDNIGAEGMQRTFRAMAPYGRVVTLMGTPSDDADQTAYVMNLTIHNVMMLTPMLLGRQDLLDAQAGRIEQGIALLAEGRLKVHVSEIFALADIRAAHARLDAGGTMGKIVLRIGS